MDNKNHDLLHTVIEGEPGTGKTELAEKLAKIYLKLGILKSNVFKKVKRSDLVAGYLGQTAIKTASQSAMPKPIRHHPNAVMMSIVLS